MEILNNFGFEPVLFFAQIVNFLLLAAVFKKFLYKPILKVLHDREEKIRKGVREAEQAKKMLEEAKVETEDLLKAAANEARAMIENTKKEAILIKEQILEESRKSSQLIITQARNQAQLEMERVEKQLGTASLALSQKILKNIIVSLFTKEEQDKIMRTAVEKLSNQKKLAD